MIEIAIVVARRILPKARRTLSVIAMVYAGRIFRKMKAVEKFDKMKPTRPIATSPNFFALDV